jgi:putative Ca2+/H+ antiporter (TMEM165/GDT1 family)
VITALLAAFGTVFLAELPDKTMFATVVLTTRYRRPLAVWTGAVAAFAVHVVLATAVGSLLRRLPETPLRAGVGLLFLTGAVLLWREGAVEESDVDAPPAPAIGFGQVAWRAAAVLGVAELGDLTQLATAGLASSPGEPVGVAIGAWAALASVAALATVAGRWLEQHVPLHAVRRVAAVAFAAFGIVALVAAFV